MVRKECSDCGCGKSEHNSKLCKSCLIIYSDNYEEYITEYYDTKKITPWHPFKLDNLKFLEQCYERKEGVR